MSNSIRIIVCAAFLAVIAHFERCAVADDVSNAENQPSFQHDVMAVLSRAGCNMGTCHSNANGKGGFKLSLRGQNPQVDFHTLTRNLGSRRVNTIRPELSLLLKKATMAIPHQGGKRFDKSSKEYRILRSWISHGLQNDEASTPKLQELIATPAHSTIYAPQVSVPLKIEARLGNGMTRDVTSLSVFESSALFVDVDQNGVAHAEHAGLSVVTARYLNKQVAIRLEFVPERPSFTFNAPAPANFIDNAVFTQLKRLRVNPSQLCDDTTFVRRAYLDATGLLPPSENAKQFVASSDPQKRAKLIDKLLASPEFVDMQTLRWADLLRVEVRMLDQKGLSVFHQWIRDSIKQGKPLNTFAKELLEARGSTYKVPATNLYRTLRDPAARGEATAQLFLGIRLQCAKCHNHPFDRWTQQDYYGWSNFFARIDYKIIENKRRDKNDKKEFVGEQIVQLKSEGDVTNPSTGLAAGLRFLGDTETGTTDDAKQDRLQRVAQWVSSPSNRRFAATQTNRIWFQLFGRGIVDPVDDFRSTNPAVNARLLEKLTDEFIRVGLKVRPLMRTIMNSATYQLSSTPNETNVESAAQFARVEPTRMTAEQTLDAVCRVLDVNARFGGHDEGTKAVQLTGVRNGNHRYAVPENGDKFLALFGKPDRQLVCECERTEQTTLAQTFEMVGGEVLSDLLRHNSGRIPTSIKRGDSNRQIIKSIYWAGLCRAASVNELAAMESHVERIGDRRRGLEDVAWAILNSNEFLLRH